MQPCRSRKAKTSFFGQRMTRMQSLMQDWMSAGNDSTRTSTGQPPRRDMVPGLAGAAPFVCWCIGVASDLSPVRPSVVDGVFRGEF